MESARLSCGAQRAAVSFELLPEYHMLQAGIDGLSHRERQRQYSSPDLAVGYVPYEYAKIDKLVNDSSFVQTGGESQ